MNIYYILHIPTNEIIKIYYFKHLKQIVPSNDFLFTNKKEANKCLTILIAIYNRIAFDREYPFRTYEEYSYEVYKYYKSTYIKPIRTEFEIIKKNDVK